MTEAIQPAITTSPRREGAIDEDAVRLARNAIAHHLAHPDESWDDVHYVGGSIIQTFTMTFEIQHDDPFLFVASTLGVPPQSLVRASIDAYKRDR